MSEKNLSKKKNTENLLVSKAVRTVLANKRHANAAAKTRGDVSGGGKKPWRQKGTGRARVGSNRSPLWRGGGVTFGPTGVQNFSLGINKKEMKAAKEAAYKAQKENIVNISVSTLKKTKEAAKLLKDNKVSGKVLVTIQDKEKYTDIKRVFKNIKDVRVAFAGNENIHDILAADKIVLVSTTKGSATPGEKESK